MNNSVITYFRGILEVSEVDRKFYFKRPEYSNCFVVSNLRELIEEGEEELK
jgi:hypothetical protein